ncbi:MAG: hypothetical protein EHM27_14835 [Deltaproteobacteria bacterium]|nr:MAG: hypothetical protein EHM27_14835 [Deltaproteobacteria bacterium]
MKRDETRRFRVFNGSEIISSFEEREATGAWLQFYRGRLAELESPRVEKVAGIRMRTRAEVEDLFSDLFAGFRSVVKAKIQRALTEVEEKFRSVPLGLTFYDEERNRENALVTLREALLKVSGDEDFRLAVMFGLTETRLALTAAIKTLPEGQSPLDLKNENAKMKEDSAAHIRRELEAAAKYFQNL